MTQTWVEEERDGRRTLTFEARVEYQPIGQSKVVLPDIYDAMDVKYKPVRVTLEVIREEYVEEWPTQPPVTESKEPQE